MELAERIADVVELSRERLGEEAARKVAMAAAVGESLHQGQVRKSDGSPYFVHPVTVAKSCLTWGLTDCTAICAALLHDTVEDAPPERDAERQIAEFDPVVLELVQSLSKIRNLQTGAGDMPATYRRILSAAAKDLRVLLVKTFDVLNNAETYHVHGLEKAQTKASFGLVYVGVARRLGIMALADVLIDHLLPFLMPAKVEKAQKILEGMQRQGAPSMERLGERISSLLGPGQAMEYFLQPKKMADFFYLAESPGTGRLRHIGWPVYRLRLLVEDEEAAWRVLGKVHGLFDPLPRHVRDYLNAPRINGFRALTTRIVWEGNPLSVHVVCLRDEVANHLGVLTHWEGSGPVSGPDPARYMRLLATLGDSDLRMSEVHTHVLPDMLDVYTPKGDRLTFPVGSVVVDFAYLVHTELGESCIGAKINGVMRGPEHALSDGDVITVVTSKEARPQRSWLNVVKTARALTLIKQALKRPDFPVRGVEREANGTFRMTSLSGPDLLWATCCLPVPREPIVGRLSGDGRWLLHLADCEKVRDNEQWERGSWDIHPSTEILSVAFTLVHRAGSLLSVLELLAKWGINGHSVQGKGFTQDVFHIHMDLGGKDPMILGAVLKELIKVPSVQEIRQFLWRL